MKNERFKNLIRRAGAFALSLTMTLSAAVYFTATEAYADSTKWWEKPHGPIDEVEYGYHWVQVHSQKEMLKYVSRTGVNTDLDNDKDYVRFMLIWNDTYFTSGEQGGGGDDGDEEWVGRRILTTYGIDPTKSEFDTRTGLDTPYLKWSGSGDRYYIRFCKPGTERISDHFLNMQMSWYGIKEWAAGYGEFVLNPSSTLDNHNGQKSRAKHASSWSRYESVQIWFGIWARDSFPEWMTDQEISAILAVYDAADQQWVDYGNGGGRWVDVATTTTKRIQNAKRDHGDDPDYDFGILDRELTIEGYPKKMSGVTAYDQYFKALCDDYYNQNKSGTNYNGHAMLTYQLPSQCVDRHFCIDGDKIEVSDQGAIMTGAVGDPFKLYIGIPSEMTKITDSVTLEPGVTVFGEFDTINPGVTVTVPQGSTLVINSHVFNHGEIYVSGGTLLVKGKLDSDVKAATGKIQGVIRISGGGVCQVSVNGSITQRTPDARIYVMYSSSLTIDGVVNTPRLSVGYGSSVRVSPGGMCVVGAVPHSTVDVTNYENAMLATNSSEQLLTLYTNMENWQDMSDYGYVVFSVNNYSSFLSDGAFILYDNSVKKPLPASSAVRFTLESVDSTSWVDAWKTTDLYQPIYYAMRFWVGRDR